MFVYPLLIMRSFLYFSLLSLVWFCSPQIRAQEEASPKVRELRAKYKELCAIWQKTDKVENATLSPAELSAARYWLGHEPAIWFSHDFLRMAAITLGNVRDRESYDQLEKLYLDTSREPARYKMVRAEAFRAMAKSDPDRTAKYVIRELTSEDRSFAVYANIVLKEAYGTSFQLMIDRMESAYRGPFRHMRQMQ